MKTILSGLTVLFLMFLGTAGAEEKVALEGNELVTYETREISRIPGVPAGLSAEEAKKLVEGGKEEATIRDKEKAILAFSFPMKRRELFVDRTISYDNGWKEKQASGTEESSEWPITFFAMVIPTAGFLIVSIANRFTRTGNRKLLTFYTAFFGIMVAGMFAGGFAGMFAGVFAGGLAGMYAGGFAGGLAGMYAGGFAGVFAGTNSEIFFPYLAFVIVAMFLSYFATLATALLAKRTGRLVVS
ncbi:MAG: hypothetical protein A2365_00370 [Candidatus Nealsonbacteria bacterium RIFOXYB1_FULL_40_15]|uniref:Uncharacterized protein n=1 Tax=Candidatus Nealsonbacteria bacterium RIFOXYB1_FULL_40_15 TaxID=1801677 RepID=A0A1G2EP43_9BACT|nr:MAG: hypothetical protein A2365_00370 [Candidatus Nealsonbacteria bacterium RIFOXYB1_FULL_40_15]